MASSSPQATITFRIISRPATSTKTFGPVDQSIQLGDGGTGITLEINSFYNFSHKVGVYGNFYYLSNPVDQNGVSNAHGGPVSASSIANGSNVNELPRSIHGQGRCESSI